MNITLVTDRDLEQLLPLLRGYCDFYRATPTDAQLFALCKALIDDPERDGLQLIARDPGGRATGFATVYWTWSTSSASRIGVMNDLYVIESARGQGIADALIEACRVQCARRGASRLTWQTALDNDRAQAVYDRIGATREQWLDYSLAAADDGEPAPAR
ncbi:MAG: GNAT family N-acetyltransferase [Solirubrobacteraceae bacterium]|jgi:GNAT superfamily N-acetyltransferase